MHECVCVGCVYNCACICLCVHVYVLMYDGACMHGMMCVSLHMTTYDYIIMTIIALNGGLKCLNNHCHNMRTAFKGSVTMI